MQIRILLHVVVLRFPLHTQFDLLLHPLPILAILPINTVLLFLTVIGRHVFYGDLVLTTVIFVFSKISVPGINISNYFDLTKALRIGLHRRTSTKLKQTSSKPSVRSFYVAE